MNEAVMTHLFVLKRQHIDYQQRVPVMTGIHRIQKSMRENAKFPHPALRFSIPLVRIERTVTTLV